MPIYAYRCAECGHTKDVLRKLSDPPLAHCPACGAEAFQKQVTAAGFQLKGSGWYATDFKGGASTGKPADTNADAPKADTAGAKADSTSAKADATPAPAAAPAAPTGAA